MLQIAVLVGAVLFFLSGLLVHRFLSASRQPAAAPVRQRDDAGDVSKLAAAVELLESKLGEAESRAREAEENVRALRDLARQQAGSAATRTPAPATRQSGPDEVQRLQGALSELEGELQEARAARREAEENVRALQDLARQQRTTGGVGGNAPAPRKPADDDQVGRMQTALARLEEALMMRGQELQDAREKMAAMEELLRQKGV
jgi:HAMP domain-containing protein